MFPGTLLFDIKYQLYPLGFTLWPGNAEELGVLALEPPRRNAAAWGSAGAEPAFLSEHVGPRTAPLKTAQQRRPWS